jgi:hypothetical protein
MKSGYGFDEDLLLIWNNLIKQLFAFVDFNKLMLQSPNDLPVCMQHKANITTRYFKPELIAFIFACDLKSCFQNKILNATCIIIQQDKREKINKYKLISEPKLVQVELLFCNHARVIMYAEKNSLTFCLQYTHIHMRIMRIVNYYHVFKEII